MSAEHKGGRFEEGKLFENDSRQHQEASSNRSKDPFKRKKSISEDRQPFTNFPEITEQTVIDLEKRGIKDLFPIQASTFDTIYGGEDVIARDLTGSGKTLAFCLPLVEKYRSKGCFVQPNQTQKPRRRVL